MKSVPSNHKSPESTGSAPALSIHRTPATAPLPHRSSPQAQLPAFRKPPPPPCSAALAARPVCAVPPPCPTRPPLHLPDSAQTASAVATKIKIRQSASALPESNPTRATAFPPPNALCTFPRQLSPAQIACRPSSLNLFPAAPAFYQSVPGQKKSAPALDSSHPAEDQSFLPHAARWDRQTHESHAQSHQPRGVKKGIHASAPSASRPNRRTAPSHK